MNYLTLAALFSLSAKAQVCTDNGGYDSFGDGCNWYTNHPSGCGGYDTSDWSSYDACCSCGGGSWGDACVDGTGTDSFGDTCSWYTNNPSGCGYYDTATFSADEQCCGCQGSSDAYDIYSSYDYYDYDYDYDYGYGSDYYGDCTSDSSYTDSFGDGCDFYDMAPSQCGYWDDGYSSAYTSCCACGGGY